MDYRKIFHPPVYGSLERSQKAAFLHYALIISAAALIIFGLLNLSWNAITLGWILLGISGFCVVSVILNKTNQYYLAAILFSALIFIAIFYNLVDGAALHDPGIAALPVFLILVSIFFRKSTIPIFTLVSILGIIALYFSWKTGFLVLKKPPTLNRVLILSILQVITGLFSWMIVSTRSDILGELDLSEKRFRSLFMAAPLGIGVISLDGKVLVYNETLIKMGGWTPDEFKLLKVQDYYANPDDRNEMLDILEAAGVVRGYETQFSRKDKSIFNVNMSVIPIKYGSEDALLTIMEDISERKQIESEKQEELEFRRLLVDSSPIFFTVVNRQGKTTMMNKSMLGALGYEWEEIIEVDYINTFVPEREQSALAKVIEEAFEHKKTPVHENHILTKSGQEILVEWNACPIINSDDEIEFIFAYGVDITERKQTEDALRDSETRYRMLFESASDAIFILREGRVIECNSSIENMFGYTKGEIIGKHPGEISPHLQPDGKESISKADVLNQQVLEGNPLLFDWVHQRKDGSEFTAEVKLHQINVQDETLSLAVLRDITERKRAEEALRESEDRYRTLFDHTAEGISIMKADKFIDVNSTWLTMFGLTRDQVIGQTPFDFSPPQQLDGRNSQDKGREYIDRALQGDPQSFEWLHIRSDGTNFDAEVFLAQIELSGEEVTLGMIRDLTERKLAEKAAQEERQRLAHELHDAVSQTLFSASMIAQTVERSYDRDPEMVRLQLKELQILTQGALAEMRNLLFELRPAALENTLMTELLQQLVDGFSGRTKTDIELSILGESQLPIEVRFVYFRLAQEALNNIVKHARAKNVLVTYASQPDGTRLLINDDGVGFDLTNVDSSQHGLNIMKERAETINAGLNIESQPGMGTKVEVVWKTK